MRIRMKRKRKRQSLGDTIFDIIVAVFLAFAVVVCVYPFLYVVSVSLSSGDAVNKGLVTLFPVDLDFDALKRVLNYKQLVDFLWKYIFLYNCGNCIQYCVYLSGGLSPVQKAVLYQKADELFACLYHVFFRWSDSDLYRGNGTGTVQYKMGNDTAGFNQRLQCYDLPFCL